MLGIFVAVEKYSCRFLLLYTAIMNKNSAGGFTIIELLVVIAIIGILAAIVLASLSTARQKGSDAAVKSEMHHAQVQADIFFYAGNPNTYTGMCSNATVQAITNAAQSAAGITLVTPMGVGPSSATVGACIVNAGGTAYAMEVPLKSDNTKYWCVDSSGISKQTTNVLPAGQVTCP
jgi:prepilin-type N-terminal cleavage/methylation domain-containing protein